MRKLKVKLGFLLLDIDEWFTKRKIYFDWFSRDKDNHVSFLSRWGFNLLFDDRD